jgi:hypothetical protein
MKYKVQEDDIRTLVKPAFDAAQSGNTPDFGKVWSNAETAYGQSQRHYKLFGCIAAAIAVAVVIVSLLPVQQAEVSDEYLIADALMNSTLWSAPSDSLLPEHQFDIYREIPFLDESTNALEGTLL